MATNGRSGPPDRLLLYPQERTFQWPHPTSAADPKQKKEGNLVGYFNSSLEVIRLAVMMYIRNPLSLRHFWTEPFRRPGRMA